MPLTEYDRYFGGRQGAAAKALEGMRQHYGDDAEAQRIFRATMEKRRTQGKGDGIARLLTQRQRQQP